MGRVEYRLGIPNFTLLSSFLYILVLVLSWSVSVLVSVNYSLGSESRVCDVSVWRFPPTLPLDVFCTSSMVAR